MSGQPEDLQQWLNELRKRAESQRSRRPPAPKPSYREAESDRARPLEEVLGERIREMTAETHPRPEPPSPRRAHYRHEAVASAHPDVDAARRRVAEETRRREDRRRREATARKEEEAKRREAERREKEAARRKRMAAARAEQADSAGRAGLTGDPVGDLRAGPAVLREAILLKEILGPPVSLRGPGETHFG